MSSVVIEDEPSSNNPSLWAPLPEEDQRWHKHVSHVKEKRRWQKQLYKFITETDPLPVEAGRSQDYTNPAYEPDDAKNKDLDSSKRTWSMVLRQVIDQQDDDDLHPYGRGGIYHNIIYGRNVKVKYDYNKMFIWIVLIGCLLLGAGAIIFASEMSIHYRKDINNPQQVQAPPATLQTNSTG